MVYVTRHNDSMTATEDLTAWLPAQVDEDERAALKPEARDWVHEATPDPSGPDHVLLIGERVVSAGFFEDDPLRPVEAEHIARHDPARILREVEAKRRIMAIHHPRPYGSIYPAVCDGCGYAGSCEDPVTEDINDCPELRILAAVYVDRPGYRDEWRP